jgi:hypothetical protein
MTGRDQRQFSKNDERLEKKRYLMRKPQMPWLLKIGFRIKPRKKIL